MPPIFGIFNTGLQPINTDIVMRMTSASNYIKERKIPMKENSRYFIASAVLADSDMLFAESGPWICISDSTIYRWTIKGTCSKTANDAEKILNAWLEWKEHCVKQFFGDFAYVIFNKETGEIFCARDHLGVRPLFYAYSAGAFIFASELRLVLAAFQDEPEINTDYFLDTLVTRKAAKYQTSFEKINRLHPAYYLKIKENQLKTTNYWSLTSQNKIVLNCEEDYIRSLREKLISSVRARTGNNTRTGTELSGGVDSSAVTGIANSIVQGKELYAYSNVYPQGTDIDFKDEREHIGTMAGFVPLKWTGIDRLNQTIFEILQHAIRIQGCFIQQNFSVFSRALYEAASKDGVTVLLSGFGGDEMISARTAFAWNELIESKEWKILKDELFHKGISLKNILKPALLALRYLQSSIGRKGFTSGVFTKELLDSRFFQFPIKKEFSAKNHLRKRLADQYLREKRKILSERQIDRLMMDHLPQRLEYCYAAAAQYGIEYRYPLLDVDLIETYLAFPPWLKQHHGINRYVFREAIKGFVPEEIRLRNDKTGSTIPQTYYSLVTEREEILGLIRDASRSPFLSEIFDFRKFPEWYEKLVRRDPKDMNYLMPGAFYTYLMILLYYRDTWK